MSTSSSLHLSLEHIEENITISQDTMIQIVITLQYSIQNVYLQVFTHTKDIHGSSNKSTLHHSTTKNYHTSVYLLITARKTYPGIVASGEPGSRSWTHLYRGRGATIYRECLSPPPPRASLDQSCGLTLTGGEGHNI